MKMAFIIHGNVFRDFSKIKEVFNGKELLKNGADVIITSPPYWAMRSYGNDPNLKCWYGDEKTRGCEHKNVVHAGLKKRGGVGKSVVGSYNRQAQQEHRLRDSDGLLCVDCGAWYGELGHEPDAERYAHNLFLIMDKVGKELLKDTGTMWIVIGDSYIGSADSKLSKSLSLAPHIFAQKMVYKGKWLLRNVIIWHKPNPVPQSARDRYTVDFEYIFFFAKKNKYFMRTPYEPLKDLTYFKPEYREKAAKIKKKIGRTTWTIKIEPEKGSHVAVFPSPLVKKILENALPPRVCNECGSPLLPIYTKAQVMPKESLRSYNGEDLKNYEEYWAQSAGGVKKNTLNNFIYQRVIAGYEPSCNCKAGFAPPVVLDPFAGSMRTLRVAEDEFHAVGVGVEANWSYVESYAEEYDEVIKVGVKNG